MTLPRTMAKGVVGLGAAALLGLMVFGAPAQGEPRIPKIAMNPPAMEVNRSGRPACDALSEYCSAFVDAFSDVLEPAVANPAEDSRYSVEGAFDTAAARLTTFESLLSEAVAEKGGIDSYTAGWIATLRGAHPVIRRAFSAYTHYFWVASQEIDANENNNKKIEEKKKKCREIGEGLTDAYRRLERAKDNPSADMKAELEEFKRVLYRTRSFELALLDLQELMVELAETGDPEESLVEYYNATRFIVVAEVLDYAPIVGNMADELGELRDEKWEAMKEGHEEFLERSESFRKQTLFRNQDGPLKGTPYAKIHDKFKKLYRDCGGK